MVELANIFVVFLLLLVDVSRGASVADNEQRPLSRSKRSLTITQADQDLITTEHNDLRRLVGAADMNELVWDPGMATIASDWVDACDTAIPTTAAGMGINTHVVGAGTLDISSVISAWASQKTFYDHVSFVCLTFVCNNYLQMVWAPTRRVSCAWNQCSPLNGAGTTAAVEFFVCVYDEPLVTNTSSWIPGTPCSQCALGDWCNNKLCAVDPCENTNCLNGGSVVNNAGSCSCNCINGYTGASCEIDPCQNTNCLNGGNVENNAGSCECDCPVRYTGTFCDNSINPAEPEVHTDDSHSSSFPIMISTAVGVGFLVILSVIVILLCYCNRIESYSHQTSSRTRSIILGLPPKTR